MNMMSLQYCANSRLFPERKPSPRPTSRSKDPTPQAMPNMVRNERSLCAQRVRKIWAKMSNSIRMGYRHYCVFLDRMVGPLFVSGSRGASAVRSEQPHGNFAYVNG